MQAFGALHEASCAPGALDTKTKELIALAIAVADKFGVTLCGFVREQRATIYTHPQRLAKSGE